MSFRRIAEVRGAVRTYAEGWQTWSPVGLLGPGGESVRAAGERDQKVMLRPGKPVPRGQVQAEGVLAMEFVDAPARAWFAPSPAREVATLRVLGDGARRLISSDGDVESVEAPDLPSVLAMVGDRLRVPQLRPIPPGWCSWSFYFKGVTERDVIENLEAAARLGLPIDVFQLDDGYETAIGDWLAPSARFGSLRRTAEAIRAAGKTAGIWLPPFLVDPRSELARQHPGWLFGGVDAGLHWGQTMRILDVTRPEPASYLRNVVETFLELGFTFFKLDFLYAGAIPGLDHYREGMRLVRDTVGPDSMLLIGGAPLLPSIGLCDAMRVGPDVLPEADNPQPDVDNIIRVTSARAWMHGRLWVNDADHVVARPEIIERDRLAAYLEGYDGVAFSGDRLAALDAHGLALTRRVLARTRTGQV